MFGFNVTAQTFSYDNRPQTPLQDYTFQQWWFVSICALYSLAVPGDERSRGAARPTVPLA